MESYLETIEICQANSSWSLANFVILTDRLRRLTRSEVPTT